MADLRFSGGASRTRWSERAMQRAVLVAAALLAALVLALSFAIDDPAQAVTVLFVVPIVLVAFAHGEAGGVGAAVAATLLLGVWVAAAEVELDAVGWLARLVAFFVVGALAGRYRDGAHRLERRRLEERYVSELQEGVVQSLVVAQYQLEAGDVAAGAQRVEEALEGAKRIISNRLGEPRPGDLRLGDPPASS